MSPNKYTELFFLDEATAFAAGHRPCCECRRDDFNKFKTLWLKANSGYNFNAKTSIQQIDSIIHGERINPDRSKIIVKENLHELPKGTFVSINDDPYIVADQQLFLWTPVGYEKGIASP